MILAVTVAVFAACYWLPVGAGRFDHALLEALHLVKWYAREHVVLCLAPAFFIAGAIAVFVGQTSVMKYLGAKANKVLAYGVASVSGTILAVCSCTVLPLFAGIYRMGAGLGPATAFLYSGPAINVLAIILTARVLGLRLGAARAIGAILFSVVIGVLMHVIFRRQGPHKVQAAAAHEEDGGGRRLWQTALFFGAMVGVLVFANLGQPPAGREDGAYAAVHRARFVIAGVLLAAVLVMVAAWFRRRELPEWGRSTWGFAKQILPLLLIGVLVAGFLLGRPEHEGLIPSRWVEAAVGGNRLSSNALASVLGALMYFATLTEVPILKGLLDSGMGNGPALALLLAGPALSLPNMLVIRSVIGTKKTVVYCLLVVVMATVSGVIFGAAFPE